MFASEQISLILKATQFASKKHLTQTRKDGITPYINHPVEVATLLWNEGDVRVPGVIAAALLHDTIEDTETTVEELESHFGIEVTRWVQEVSDDKTLPKEERKRMQIIHAPTASRGAKQIKLADKICNVRDLVNRPPYDWSLERKIQYLDWSDQVVAGLREGHGPLETLYDSVIKKAREAFQTGTS